MILNNFQTSRTSQPLHPSARWRRIPEKLEKRKGVWPEPQRRCGTAQWRSPAGRCFPTTSLCPSKARSYQVHLYLVPGMCFKRNPLLIIAHFYTVFTTVLSDPPCDANLDAQFGPCAECRRGSRSKGPNIYICIHVCAR